MTLNPRKMQHIHQIPDDQKYHLKMTSERHKAQLPFEEVNLPRPYLQFKGRKTGSMSSDSTPLVSLEIVPRVSVSLQSIFFLLAVHAF